MRNHLEFTLSLHRHAAPGADRDFCWSPYSVASALGLVAAASAGTTRAELVSALRCTDDDTALSALRELVSDAAKLADTAPAGDEPVLAVSNTLWADAAVPVERSYARSLGEWPGGAVREAEFRDDPESTRQRINADVAETTRELIPELIEPGAIDSDTVAAVVNALYLKTSWAGSFDEHATAPLPFHAPGGVRDVDTMRMNRRLPYARRDGWQVVTVPAEGDVEAVVLLPDGDLADAEASLDGGRLEELVSSAEQQQVELLLPKFDASGDAELSGPLGDLGVHTVFTPAADFSPLTGESLRVSTVVHQSVLRVDEHGLEGAAATAAMMRLTAVIEEPEPIRVHVDRPFLFLVRHRRTGAVYFLARVATPG